MVQMVGHGACMYMHVSCVQKAHILSNLAQQQEPSKQGAAGQSTRQDVLNMRGGPQGLMQLHICKVQSMHNIIIG